MADIKDLTVLPRPRSAWQAMDAGFTLARAHYVRLVILWLGFALPIFIVCALLQFLIGWSAWSLMLFVWWWFKPLYELPIIIYLSRALFSEQLSIRATWRIALSHFGKMFTTYLTLARLSTARALTYGVVFLEQLPRKQRAARVQTLTTETTRHYLLMLVCLHIEIILAYGIITTTALLFFSDALADFDWSTYVAAVESPAIAPWLAATSVVTLISAALVAPFYVTAGFLIYINRRMQLEAWDIEHRFRNIKSRSGSGIAAALLLVFAVAASDPSVAEDRARSLVSPNSVEAILDDILDDDDFGSTQTQWLPKFDFDNDDASEFDGSMFDFLRGTTTTFALVAKAILWFAITVFVILLIYTIRQFRRPQLARSALSRSGRDGEDAKNHPLTQNLPNDIVAEAERLLSQGERRQALSVLFRGALRAVMEQHDLKVARGATESDCKENISAVGNELQTKTFSKLLNVWQKEAYANQPQDEQVIAGLIDAWKAAFVAKSKPNAEQIGQAS